MLSVLLPPTLVGVLAGTLLILSTATAGTLFIPFIIVKLIPLPALRRACTDALFGIANYWTSFNRFVYRLHYPIAWDIELHGTLDPHKSYLLIGNHQSWIDILLAFDQFSRRTPPLCFFLKRELIWMPVIGWACWGMDFPFMSRRSQRQDLAETRKFCERFRDRPVTVANFAEGTRFTEEKRLANRSPYRHLLRPKAAGLAFTLDAMGEQFAGIIDLTIAYRPSKHPVLWSFLIGEQADLAIRIDVLPVPAELTGGDYSGDKAFRERFQTWLNALWARKDAWLERMINRPAAAARPRTT